MTNEERLKQIDVHFNNITTEQLDQGLERAGMGRIKSCSEDGMRLLTDDDLEFLAEMSKRETGSGFFEKKEETMYILNDNLNAIKWGGYSDWVTCDCGTSFSLSLYKDCPDCSLKDEKEEKQC